MEKGKALDDSYRLKEIVMRGSGTKTKPTDKEFMKEPVQSENILAFGKQGHLRVEVGPLSKTGHIMKASFMQMPDTAKVQLNIPTVPCMRAISAITKYRDLEL